MVYTVISSLVPVTLCSVSYLWHSKCICNCTDYTWHIVCFIILWFGTPRFKRLSSEPDPFTFLHRHRTNKSSLILNLSRIFQGTMSCKKHGSMTALWEASKTLFTEAHNLHKSWRHSLELNQTSTVHVWNMQQEIFWIVVQCNNFI